MTSTRPGISVVLPFYNADKWLSRALLSLRQQVNVDLHVIAIDDGSSDNSYLKVQQEADRGLPVTLLRNERNLGIVASLNRGLDVADTPFIARMDADDICLPRRLEMQLRFIETGNADLCGSWFKEFGAGIPRSVHWHSGEEDLRAAMLFQNTICHPTVFARREVFDKFRYRSGYELAEDYDLFTRALGEFRLANVPDVLLWYRRHRYQATRARRVAMEAVTRKIRIQALQAQGIHSSPDEQRIHNLIRAPQSITSLADLEAIEAWLLKLIDRFEHPDARRAIAAQWTRAAVRAAPLGRTMWRAYRRSPLHNLLFRRVAGDTDLALLAALRLNYGSPAFESLRRFGFSA